MLHQCRIILEITSSYRTHYYASLILVTTLTHVTCVPTSEPLLKGKRQSLLFFCTIPTSYANRIASSPSLPLVIQWLPFAIQSVYFLRGVNFISRGACHSFMCACTPKKKMVLPLHFNHGLLKGDTALPSCIACAFSFISYVCAFPAVYFTPSAT